MNDSEWFLQIDQRRTLQEAGTGAWTVLWEQIHDDETTNLGRYSALASTARRDEILEKPSWDLMVDSGGPGFTVWYEGDEKRTEYSRVGFDDGVEPFVHHRSFHGVRPSYVELSEQFRLFHNLYDAGDGKLFRIEDDGTETLAAEVSTDLIRVATRLVRQYQAARQLDLLLFVDSVRYVSELPSDTAGTSEEIKTDTVRSSLYVGDLTTSHRHFSRFLGKKVLPPPPIDMCEVWPYNNEPENYPEFIIGVDEEGREIRHSCDPDRLANYFGANPGAPHYLTPVHFKREVLQRYYEQPEKYSVEDSYLRCAGLWGLRMDNNHDENVVVYLGDLGRDLPARERDYWQPFSIPSSGAPVSETAFRRDFLAQFAPAVSSDIVFRRLYERVAALWQRQLGWDLYRVPNPGDEHILQRVRLPLTESQPEFEGQLLNVARLMIDFLNDGEIKNRISGDTSNMKSIAKLEAFLTQEGYPELGRDIAYLRNLQELRSKGAAHRKGSEFSTILRNVVGESDNRTAMKILLDRGIELLRSLSTHFHLEDVDEEPEPPGT